MNAPLDARAPVFTSPLTLESLLGDALRDQQDLSAVELFSKAHDDGAIPGHAKQYALLMPAAPPGPGQQYAFDVDLDRCTSCKACVAACHNLNGLDETETWRSTGLLLGGTPDQPFQQTVTTACHHCVEPACMHGCPVNAYEKDAITGIVRHLDDQCIGCKYCTLTCPYDVPQYNKARGIVRKCDMCSSRLSAGEAPACVQACPNEAIRIKVVEVEEIVERSEAGIFLPGAVGPEISQPTTTYTSKKPLPPNLLPADYHRVRKEDAHLPLVFMLVLTQLSVGTFLWDFLLKVFWGGGVATHGKALYSAGALGLGLLALVASTAHIGRPQYAFRAVLGLRRSWLSREILAFGAYAGAATLYALSFYPDLLRLPLQGLSEPAFAATVLLGVFGVFTSVKVYAVTHRPLWVLPLTAFKFFGTALLLGLSLTFLVSILSLGVEALPFLAGSGRIMAFLIMGIATAKLLQEVSLLSHLKDPFVSPYRRAATLMAGPLRRSTGWRFATALAGGIACPALLVFGNPSAGGALALAGLSFVTLVVSELLERYLFFTTSVTRRMPGGPVA